MVVLVWKVAMGLIDGYDLKFKGEQSRRGREVILADVVRSSPACVRKARTNSMSIPDQPTIAEEGRVAQSNCLLHQIPLARINKY